MSITSKAFRIALTASALVSAAATAEAKPRRVVILDFDGPRGLADTGHDAVVALLGESYDVIATKRWEDARAAAMQKTHGPQVWSKAAKSSGVDAVIEGWIQDEGRHKVLTVAVREAASGNEIDSVSIKLGAKGLTEQSKSKLASELDGVLEYIEGTMDPVGSGLRPVETRKMLGAKTPKTEETAKPTDDDADEKPAKKASRKKVAEASDEATEDDADEKPAKKKAKKAAPAESEETEIEIDAADAAPKKAKAKDKEVATATDTEAKDNADLVSLFGATSDEGKKIDPAASHTPKPTPRFQIGAGGYYASRTLAFEAENQTGPQTYAGVPHKGLEINAAVYPFPLKKMDGGLSGIGFSFGIAHSAGSVVTFDDLETVAEYNINQSSFDLGVHYRYPIADLVSIDGHVNYGRTSYIINDAPESFEVPDTEYSYLGAGVKLDLNIADVASVGFGAKYMYLLDVGDIGSVDWYGPGRSSGYGLDSNVIIPLPKSLFVEGALDYQKFSTDYDGVGQVTEDEGVASSSDSTVTGRVNLGIKF